MYTQIRRNYLTVRKWRKLLAWMVVFNHETFPPYGASLIHIAWRHGFSLNVHIRNLSLGLQICKPFLYRSTNKKVIEEKPRKNDENCSPTSTGNVVKCEIKFQENNFLVLQDERSQHARHWWAADWGHYTQEMSRTAGGKSPATEGGSRWLDC